MLHLEHNVVKMKGADLDQRNSDRVGGNDRLRDESSRPSYRSI